MGAKSYILEQVLDEKQLQLVVKASTGADSWELVGCELGAAGEGLAGFLGDHIRAALHIRLGGHDTTLRLFIKRVPLGNKPKADFIDDNDFFRREVLMFKLAGELRGAEGSHPWCTKAYFYSDYIVVMPDLSAEGYTTQPLLETYDLSHVLVAVTSLARFHAAFANYEARRSTRSTGHYTILQDHGHIINERIFKDGPWVQAAAKLTTNMLIQFSKKYNAVQDLERVLFKLYVEACDSVQEYDDTLNVLLHRDLWNNNIMFKHEGGEPVNCILIDFQCTRYGPPGFDLMVFLYLTTARRFRQQYEKDIFRHYYSTFCQNLEDVAKTRMKVLAYDEQEFLKWCEIGRKFGMFVAMSIFPFTLMDPKVAEETFDNPETFQKYIYEDRTEPVVRYAHKCKEYRERQVETAEEYLERYVL